MTVWSLPPYFTVCPIGLVFGQYFLAMYSFTIITRAAELSSCSEKSRPCLIGMPIAAKYPGVANPPIQLFASRPRIALQARREIGHQEVLADEPLVHGRHVLEVAQKQP